MAENGSEIIERDGIITVVIDRQEKRNAISPSITAAFWEAANALADREDLRVMVITGRGKFFTAGIDLNHPAADRRDGKLASDIAYRRQYRRHHLLYDEFETIEKPIILAAQGPCLGAGVEMAASCDFRFASASTYFQLPEVRLGVIAGSGGTSRVTRLVGPHWGKWMAMAGQRVDAEQAKAIGFVHDVFPDEKFQESVDSFARSLVEIPMEALGAAKLVADIARDTDRTTQRHVDRIANGPRAASAEFSSNTKPFSNS
jgi:enoyl-CoA hydratase/carnithine racemase